MYCYSSSPVRIAKMDCIAGLSERLKIDGTEVAYPKSLWLLYLNLHEDKSINNEKCHRY